MCVCLCVCIYIYIDRQAEDCHRMGRNQLEEEREKFTKFLSLHRYEDNP